METNFKLIKNGTEVFESQTIHWVTWPINRGMQFMHDGPLLNRSLVLDFKPMTMDALIALSSSSYSSIDEKSTYQYLTSPITKMISNELDYIEFETIEGTYQLYINRNPVGKSKSPFSEE